MRIEMLERADARNFTAGRAVHVHVSWRTGQLVRSSRLRVALTSLWRRATWWRQPRSVVIAIDTANGRVTVASMRWSWRRWRWEIDDVLGRERRGA